MPNPLQNAFTHTPVTALAVNGDLIFSAQGSSLRIYKFYEPHDLIASGQLFEAQIIHGIAVHRNTNDKSKLLLVWGGRDLAAVRVEEHVKSTSNSTVDITIRKLGLVRLPDWILDVSFRPDANAMSARLSDHEVLEAVLITAHNVLYQINVSKVTSTNTRFLDLLLKCFEIEQGPRCILYSAHLKWSSATEVLVASGTAFGEIVVWCHSKANETGPNIRSNLVFNGHEGSIFGVQISDLVDVCSGNIIRFLTSCSDDRSIRVWDISDAVMFQSSQLSLKAVGKSQELRTTGFLSDLTEDSETNKQNRSLAVAMGHVSRIWSIRYAYSVHPRKESQPLLTIVSVGEDASCQKWNLSCDIKSNHKSLQSGLTFSLTHIDTVLHHAGKNIWSIAVHPDLKSTEDFCVLTGGADASIICSPLSTSNSPEVKPEDTFEINDVFRTLETGISKPEEKPTDLKRRVPKRRNKIMKDCFRSYTYVKDDALLVTTNNGLILLAQSNSRELPKWKWRYITTMEDDLKGYSVACSIPGTEYSFLGGAKGSVLVFNSITSEITLMMRVRGKIANLFTQTLEPTSPDFATLLVVPLGGPPPQQLFLRRSEPNSLLISKTVELTASYSDQSEANVTSYAHMNTYLGSQSVFLGYRNGTIRLFSSNLETSSISLLRAHDHEAVTSMKWIDGSPSASGFGFLLSVGRNGMITVHQFIAYNKPPILVHKLTLPIGPNLEGIYLNPKTNEVCLYGFHGKDFVVHDLSNSRNVMTVECGGAHRIWNFMPHVDSTGTLLGGSFTWTKASVLNTISTFKPSHTVIEPGSHGREIKACAVASRALEGTSLGTIFASGAEDTDIRLSYYSDQGQMQNLSVLRKHVTGVQSLGWSADGNFLFSCGGYEEFFVWRLRATPGVLVGVLCESACPKENEKSDLRIMDFAVREQPEQIKRNGFRNGDEGSSFLVALAYSNSLVKIWQYTSREGSASWTLLATAHYTSACITEIALLDYPGSITVLTASTDGHLALWTAPKQSILEESHDDVSNSIEPYEMSCIRVQTVHQNSTKSISLWSLPQLTWLVLTTGDDNAIGITLVRMSPVSGNPTMSTLAIPRAHAAAINAAKFISVSPVEGSDSTVWIAHTATASNDQQVKLWDIEIDITKAGVEGVSVRRVAKRFSAVADISSMTVFPVDDHEGTEKRVLICGVGTEIWRVS